MRVCSYKDKVLLRVHWSAWDDYYDDPNWISSCNYSLEHPYANMKGTHVLCNDFLASFVCLWFTAVHLFLWTPLTRVTVTLQTRTMESKQNKRRNKQNKRWEDCLKSVNMHQGCLRLHNEVVYTTKHLCLNIVKLMFDDVWRCFVWWYFIA